MNKYKEVPKEEEYEEVKKTVSKSKSKIARSFLNVFSGNFLSKENVIYQLPFILFLTFIGLCYIANGYYAEKSVRDISRLNNELKELKSEFITNKSELMFMSNQSEVARASASIGLKESVTPPKKIVVKIKSNEEEK